MRSKKYAILISILISGSLLFLSGCKSDKLNSVFTETPITIDGNYSDWAEIPAIYYEKQDVLFAVCNDTNNLYLAFRFRDPKWAMSIRITGLTIWIDTLGKKKENFGIRYSGGPKPQNMRGFGGENRNMRFDKMPADRKREMEERMADSSHQFVVLDSDWWYKEQAIRQDGSQGPSAKYGIDHDMYTYEFSLPLAYLNEPSYGIGTRPGQLISIGLQWGDFGMERRDDETRPESINGGEDGGFPGMDGGNGIPGGMRGGMDRGMRRGGLDMPEEQKIWIKTKLASAGGNIDNNSKQ